MSICSIGEEIALIQSTTKVLQVQELEKIGIVNNTGSINLCTIDL